MSEERGQVSQERGAEGIAMSAEVARWLAVPFQEIQGTMAGGGGGVEPGHYFLSDPPQQGYLIRCCSVRLPAVPLLLQG